MPETIGVVVRTKDRPLLLRRTLESIENQLYADVSVIIVNEGKEQDIVERIASTFAISSKINIIHHQKPLGPAAAANRGIDALRTKYVSFLDDDNSWSPEFLQRCIATLKYHKERFPTLRAVASYTNEVHEHLDSNNFIHIDNVTNLFSSTPEGILALPNVFNAPPILNNATLIDLESAKSIGGFDESLTLLEDWEFHVRFASNYDIWILPHVLAFNHLRPGEYGCYANLSNIDKNIVPHYYRYLCNRWIRSGVQGKRHLGLLAQLAPLVGQLHNNTVVANDVLEALQGAEGGNGNYPYELNSASMPLNHPASAPYDPSLLENTYAL